MPNELEEKTPTDFAALREELATVPNARKHTLDDMAQKMAMEIDQWLRDPDARERVWVKNVEIEREIVLNPDGTTYRPGARLVTMTVLFED